MLTVWNWCYHSLLAFWNLSENSLPLSVGIWNFLFFKIDKEPQLLYAEVEKKLPSAVPTRWNHNNRLLETMQKHKTDFQNLFITIIRMVVTGTQKVCALRMATWHSWGTQILIFPKQCFLSNSLFQIQPKSSDNVYCTENNDNFKLLLQQFWENFDSL
jgi:hypothetical protein